MSDPVFILFMPSSAPVAENDQHAPWKKKKTTENIIFFSLYFAAT